MITRLIDSILNGIALIIAAWAILGSFASWRLARRRRTWGQWGHLAMLLVFVALTVYLIVSFGSVIIAAHS